jgi:hypothetical protein
MSNLYVYGVLPESDLELAVEGVAGADRVYTVDYRSLSAVVSDIDTTDPERTDEAVTRHNEVLQTVLEDDGGRTVVPMQFGMAFKDARTLKGVLRGARRAFRKTLDEIDGTVELGLKLVADADAAVDGEAVRASVADRLEDIVVEASEDDRFSDRLVLNRSYLVDRGDRPAFDDAVDEIEAAHEGVTVQYTGPWPPYNFVDIRIGAEGQR